MILWFWWNTLRPVGLGRSMIVRNATKTHRLKPVLLRDRQQRLVRRADVLVERVQ